MTDIQKQIVEWLKDSGYAETSKDGVDNVNASFPITHTDHNYMCHTHNEGLAIVEK